MPILIFNSFSLFSKSNAVGDKSFLIFIAIACHESMKINPFFQFSLFKVEIILHRLLQMIKSGIIQKLRNVWLADEQSVLQQCRGPPILTIGMAETNSLFVLLALGMGMAVLTLLLECVVHSKKSRSRK